ncbi:MAG TPA: hypothetical protein VL738_39405 [Dactylosporangium sp.]|jgi:flagellar biogenesis protein FliO|nr:hypothetical protein [Dactylosporangium sp.]
MEFVLADAAPSPSFMAGTVVVLALGCLVFVAALVVLIVWLVRRTKNSRY